MSDNKKIQILSAADELFARFGYKKTTLEDIGNKIGLNKASLYHYFDGGKEHIFVAVILNKLEEFIVKLQEEISAVSDCKQRILIYFERKHDFWSQHSHILPQIKDLNPETVKKFMGPGKEMYLEIEGGEKIFVSNILKNCIKNREIRDCDVDKVTDYMFAIADGIKDKSMGFNESGVPTSYADESTIKDIQEALSIFIDGLK